jgi:tetratricopeptide (TPR) repeat protein
MRFLTGARAIFVLIIIFAIFESPVLGQGTDDAYKVERQKAIDLYNQDKYFEALPLFEDLVKQNPADSQTLVGLASCLVNHSATVQDPDAAAKERLRARDLLLKAKELGNNSNLLQNLLQLLQASDSGKIKYSDNPEADKVFRLAEAAFARRDLTEAIKDYSKALELDPGNYSASLFIGDSYFAEKDFTKAGEWYERTAQIDPNKETAYRYYADMLTKNGEMDKARTKAIQAVIAEPYNPITWRGLQQWATSNKLQLNQVFIKVPNSVTQKDDKNITISVDPSQKNASGAAWMIYSITQAAWRGEEFRKNFPNEKQYRHSLPEETQALTMAAESLTGKDKKKSLKPPDDPNLALLVRIYQAGMIEPYVLLNAADAGIAQDYDSYRGKNRAKLEEYMSTFVVPPAVAKH